jgi:hypothetical protein
MSNPTQFIWLFYDESNKLATHIADLMHTKLFDNLIVVGISNKNFEHNEIIYQTHKHHAIVFNHEEFFSNTFLKQLRKYAKSVVVHVGANGKGKNYGSFAGSAVTEDLHDWFLKEYGDRLTQEDMDKITELASVPKQ